MKLAGALVSAVLFTARAYAQCTGCFHPSLPAPRLYLNLATSFVIGDFDRDGVPDIVYTFGNGVDSAGIGFQKGSGSGSFAAPITFPSTSSNSIVAADFNGDGFLDVATAGDLVSVFLGNGDGTFQAPIEFAHDSYGNSWISAADFNGDGIPDLAVNVFSYGHPRIFIGNGDGTFQPPSELPMIFGSFLTTADFNADGRADVAVSGIEGIYVFLGDGHGGFAAPRISALGSTSFTVGDFNGDGFPDLAEDDFLDVLIQLGNGDGTFTQGATLTTGNGSNTMATGDFDLDGKLDLAVAVYQDGNLIVFPGLGDGTFGPGVSTPAGDNIGPILVSDFDANGRLDVAVLIYYSSIEILLSDSDGAFPKPYYYPTGGETQPGVRVSLAIADLTADGFQDIAVTNQDDHNIGILVGDGAGHFTDPLIVPTVGPPLWVTTGTFDPGTGVDMAVASDAGVQVFLFMGGQMFGAMPPFGPACSFVTAADLNDDGIMDLAIGANVSVWFGNGDGTFTAGPALPGSPTGDYVLTGDFNGDDVPDLVVTSGNLISLFVNDGHGSFTAGPSFALVGNAIVRSAVGDFDGDGKLDIAGGTSDGGGTSTLTFFWGKGDGTFDPATTLSGPFGAISMIAADVNGDGFDDLLLDGTLIFASHGDRTFELDAWANPLGIAWFEVGDLNGDGKPDAVFGGGFPEKVAVLLNTICVPSRLAIVSEPTSCDQHGVPFDTQPVLRVLDDGDNVMTCDTGSVTATLRAGTGTPGASLGGTTTVPTSLGVATFNDLSIDLAGRGYMLDFTHPVGMVHSRTLSQDLSAAITGPALSCVTSPASYRSAGGYDRYSWLLDGTFFSRADVVSLAGVEAGMHTLGLAVYQDGCLATNTVVVTVEDAFPPPTIVAPRSVRVGASGLTASATDGASSYTWSISVGTITGGQGTSQITFDAGPPGTTMVLGVIAAGASGCAAPEVFALVQVDFSDTGSSPFREDIDTLARNGITAGCGPGVYCPDQDVTRAQMAVFLLKAEHGPFYVPPVPFGSGFEDVPPGSFAHDWIAQLHLEGITQGCDPTHYCPDAPVRRDEMAVFLLKTEHGSDYVPPACAGIFGDVECVPNPAFAVDWVERLYAEGVTAGCGTDPLIYCANASVTRGSMATFLVRTFNMQ
jgi:hypothetical protein